MGRIRRIVSSAGRNVHGANCPWGEKSWHLTILGWSSSWANKECLAFHQHTTCSYYEDVSLEAVNCTVTDKDTRITRNSVFPSWVKLSILWSHNAQPLAMKCGDGCVIGRRLRTTFHLRRCNVPLLVDEKLQNPPLSNLNTGVYTAGLAGNKLKSNWQKRLYWRV